MGVLALPDVPELRDRSRLALRAEDRVVAEALRAALVVPDGSCERGDDHVFRPVCGDGADVAGVAGTAFVHAVQPAEDPLPAAALAAVPSREHARCAAERRDLDARFLAEHPLA